MEWTIRHFSAPVVLAIILSVYLLEAHACQTFRPTPARQGDQGSYLHYARRMYETNHRVVGGRNQMPGYPFLLSFLYRPHMTEKEFLGRAQAFNVNLSAVILLLLFFIYRRHFPALESVALVAITAFPVFYYRSVAAQTEVLYYFVSFCLFAVFWRMLATPSIRLALWGGGLAGLAYLCKGSVLPGVAIFAITFAARILWGGRTPPGRPTGEVLRGFIILAITLASFLLVIFPYIQTSKRVFGQYFYNVNTSFYFWCDSWAEAKAFSKASGDRIGPPALPADQIPSPAKYWREHSIPQILGRWSRGLIQNSIHNARPEGYYKYVLLLLGTAVALALRRRTEFVAAVRSHPFTCVFLLFYFPGYWALYAWYERVSGDSRFLLALYLPFIFAAWKVISHLGRPTTVSFGARRFALLPALASFLLALAAAEAIYNAVRLAVTVHSHGGQPVALVIEAWPGPWAGDSSERIFLPFSTSRITLLR